MLDSHQNAGALNGGKVYIKLQLVLSQNKTMVRKTSTL